MAILIAFMIHYVRERGPAVLIWTSCILALSLLLLPAGYTHRIYSIFDFSADPTGSSEDRWRSMLIAWNAMLAHPLLGIGLGMQNLAFLEQLGSWRQTGVHNVYLQIGAEVGVPALVVYLLANWHLFRGVRQSLKRVRQFPEAREFLALGNSIQIALVGFLVGAFFAPVAYHFYFFYIAGFAVTFQEIAKRSHASLTVGASPASVPHYAPEN